MRSVRAFLLGAAATGAVTYVFVAALALVVAAGGSTIHLGVGPLVLVSVEQRRELDDDGLRFGAASSSHSSAAFSTSLPPACFVVASRREAIT